MRSGDILQLSTRMFKTRKMRTALTILGIGIGIGSIVFLVSLGYGLQKALIEQITSSDALLSLDVVQGEKAVLTLNNNILSEIKSFPEVKEVVPMVSLRGQILYENTTGDAIMNITSKEFLQLAGLKLEAGSFFYDDSDEVIISKAVARVFNIEDAKEIIGKNVKVSFLAVKINESGQEELNLVDQSSDFKVVGVVGDESSSFVYFPISKVTGLTLDSYSQFKVRVHTTADLDPVRNKILDKGFSVAALSDVVDQANKIFGILQIILAVFGIVALVVSAIGMFNTMTIALMERTQEVGIMKSLGAARKDIMLMFVTESMAMGFLGGVVGLLVGFLGGQAFNLILNLLAKRFGGKVVDIFYTPMWFIITIIVFSTVVGFITGLYPARRAARLNPLEAVRYK